MKQFRWILFTVILCTGQMYGDIVLNDSECQYWIISKMMILLMEKNQKTKIRKWNIEMDLTTKCEEKDIFKSIFFLPVWMLKKMKMKKKKKKDDDFDDE